MKTFKPAGLFVALAITQLTLPLPSSVSAATIAVHQRDTANLTNDYARLYNTSGNLVANLSYSGTTGSPSGYFLQSLDSDPFTGNVSGLVRAPSRGNTARILTWNPSGALLSDAQLNGYATDGYNYGMDVAVHNGIAAVHRRDSYNLTYDQARLYNMSGNLVANLSYSGTAGNPTGYTIQSLDWDTSTGNLSGLIRAPSLGNTARILTWNPNGTLLSEVQLNGYPTESYNYGMDMAVHNGIIAVHRRDTINLTSDYARLYDTSGSVIANLSYSGTASNPSGYYLQSLDWNIETGNLLGLVRAYNSGYTTRILTWNPTGTLLSDVELNGYPVDGSKYGVDFTVLAPDPTIIPEPTVPEPSTLLLGIFTTLGLLLRKKR